MTFREYYRKLKRLKKKEKQEARDKTPMYTKGMYDQPKRNAGDKNYVNTPPMMNPPTYTPTDTGQSR